jgi:hypothetical protein
MTEAEIKAIGTFILCGLNPNLDPRAAAKKAEEIIAAINHKPEFEAGARANVPIEKSWDEGVKHITGETRLRDARNKFIRWVKLTGLRSVRTGVPHRGLHTLIPVYRGLADWQEQGFTLSELEQLKKKFDLTEKTSLQPSPIPKARKHSLATKKSGRATKKPS